MHASRHLNKDRDHIRGLPCLPTGGVVVTVKAGTYGPLVLEARDSGTAHSPITYRTSEGAVLSAGLPIPAKAWQRMPGDNASLPVYAANLTELGLLDLGTMLTGGLFDCQVVPAVMCIHFSLLCNVQDLPARRD